MMFDRIGKKPACLSVGIFILLALATFSYAETDFAELLSIRDKGELNKVIDEAMKVVDRNPKDRDGLITLGIAYHNLGDIGESTAPKESVKYLKQAEELYPDDDLILALLGSSTTMMGRYSKWKITEGRKLVGKGGGILDRAVMRSPDNVLVRMIRANNALGLPTFFGRRHYFKDDLLHIKQLIDKSPSGYENTFKAQVYYRLGKAYEDEGDDSSAKAYFKKAIEVAPDSRSAKEAQKEL